MMGLDLSSVSYIVQGIGVTLMYTLYSFLAGYCVAMMVVLMRISKLKILNYCAMFYVSIFRGTPVLVQLSIVYFGLPLSMGFKIDVFEAGIITFSLNSAAYIAEILRSGINSVCKGQLEAAKSLSISYRDTMGKIILPQALRVSLPGLVNEFVNLLKETAIISMIGGYDLMKRAQVVAAEKYIYMEPLLVAALCYYFMVMMFSTFAKYIERRVV
ncbi:MAG: amino acid ABC transporter permease [Rickettsiales bacterium]